MYQLRISRIAKIYVTVSREAPLLLPLPALFISETSNNNKLL